MHTQPLCTTGAMRSSTPWMPPDAIWAFSRCRPRRLAAGRGGAEGEHDVLQRHIHMHDAGPVALKETARCIPHVGPSHLFRQFVSRYDTQRVVQIRVHQFIDDVETGRVGEEVEEAEDVLRLGCGKSTHDGYLLQGTLHNGLSVEGGACFDAGAAQPLDGNEGGGGGGGRPIASTLSPPSAFALEGHPHLDLPLQTVLELLDILIAELTILTM